MMEINNITVEQQDDNFDIFKDIIENVKFERNVWAEKKLCSLCPNNNIKNLGAVFDIEDTEKQMSIMQDIIIILHDAYEFKQQIIAKRNGTEFNSYLLTKPYLDCLNENETLEVLNIALEQFKDDGEVTVVAEPKKNVNQEIESTSINPGISTSADQSE